MIRKHAHPAARWALRLLASLVALVAAYGLAGLIGGAIPANANWRPAEQGVRIYVDDNGVHTGLVLPQVAAGVDWRGQLRGDALADPRYAGLSHVAFGWGDRAFYVETPHWSDIKLSTILRAAGGSRRTVVHVEHLSEPRVEPGRKSVVLRPDEYRRLAAFIRATFATEPDAPAPIHGYFANDAFYSGRGTYSAINTCNAWTGAALRAAGVKIGLWTPFPVTVMQWF